MYVNFKKQLIVTLVLGLALVVQGYLVSAPAHAASSEGRSVFGSFNLSIGTLEPAAQIDLLTKNGYDGIVVAGGNAEKLSKFLEVPAVRAGTFKLIANFWLVDLSKPTNQDELHAIARELQKAKAELWLTFWGNPAPRELRDRLGQLADIAKAYDVTVVLYPHYGGGLVTTEEAIRWMKAINRDNVKITLHLCHELKAGNGGRLPEIIKKAAPYLAGVTINGADRDVVGEGVEGDGLGYERSIQTLGQGDFNVRDEFYLPLIRAGYQGPFVLHDYGIKDPSQHFARSMTVWKSWQRRVAQ